MDEVAVVTGGGGGIGAATAHRLSQAGYRVVVMALQRGAAQGVVDEIGGSRAMAFACDVLDADAFDAVLAEVEAAWAPVSVLVNNAGIISYAPFLELEVAAFRAVMDVNVTGVFACTQVAARRMISAGVPGRVVNLASINSSSVSTANLAHYAASKGAVQMLTRASALELAPHGIRVNAVAPGVVETPLVASSLADPRLREHWERRIPRGSLTTPRDVADTIVMLAAPDLHAVTGVTVPVDGGEHIGGARVD